MGTTETSLRVYIASLCDYNSGILHGIWLDVTDVDTMQEAINKMLAESPTAKREGCVAEEWSIHDSEFGGVNVGEQESLETLWSWAKGFEEHGDAFLAWVNNSPHDNTEESDFVDVFRGEWDSLADYVADFWEQNGDFKANDHWAHPTNFIDWESLAHSWELNGDVWTERSTNGKVWIFDNR